MLRLTRLARSFVQPTRTRRCVYTTTTNSLSNDAEVFGNYNIILPEEPFVFGVSHIQPLRPISSHIKRPSYASVPPTEEPKGNGKIELGGEEEAKLRDAARLARNVREFAGLLVKVCRLTIDNCEVDGVFFSSSR
jgi:methionyl aminopeptidase